MAENRPRRGPGRPGGPGGGFVPGEKAKNFRGTLGKVLRYIGAYRIAILMVALFAIGGTVFNIIGP